MKSRRAKTAIRPLRWLGLISAALILAGGALMLGIIVDSHRKIDALYASSMADRAQLVASGQTPVGRPPQDIVGDRGPPGQAGRDGRDGLSIPGPQGAPGRDGRDATPAQVAAAVAAYLRAHPPKAGPAGRDGRDGTDGQSPACLAEVDQCRGATGPKGDPGSQGNPPSAWRWTDPATGTAYACTRDPASSDGAPVYGCTAEH